MKNVISIIAIAASLLTLAACSSSSNGPEAAAKKSFSALQKGDYDAYAASFNLPESDQKMLAGLTEEKVAEEMQEKGGIKKYTITESEIEEENATVTVHVIYEDGTEEDEKLTFVKVGDEWLQELNK